MTIQHTYLYSEVVADWNASAANAQHTYLHSEVIAAIGSGPATATTIKLYAEVIHAVDAITPSANVPILISCT